MPAPAAVPNLYGLDRQGLAAALGPLELPQYRVQQVYAALYRRDALDPGGWTDLPAPLRGALTERFRIARPSVAETCPADDGTTKLVLELPAGGRVEAVAIPAGGRMTFCISSQVGCAYGCSFCMTAKLGFIRHLDAGEIAGQVAALVEFTRAVSGRYNVVFMGMGEPLHNVDNVLSALGLLTDPAGFALGPRRITVSTVGIPQGIARLSAVERSPRLAVSLVAADQEVRASLMPVAKAVTLDELADAVRAFGAGRRDTPTLEVVMLRDVNDQPRLAHQLADLAQRAEAKVNLIEFNPTPELPYQPSPEERIQFFMRVMRDAGVVGTVRRSRGKDAYAACGQLAFMQQAGSDRTSATRSVRPQR